MFLLGHAGLVAFGWLATGRRLPLWPLVLGALLPDLVDKPLGFALGLGYGRLIMHTLLVALVVGAFAAWRRSPAWASLALGLASHLVLDQLWRLPEVLLWPAFGPFPRGDWGVAEYAAVAVEPYTIMMEVLGAMGLALAGLWVWKEEKSGVRERVMALVRRARLTRADPAEGERAGADEVTRPG